FVAEALALPAESFLAEQMEVVDPDALHDARNTLRHALAEALKDEFQQVYKGNTTAGPYSPDARSMGKRALRNLSLAYLAELGLSKVAYEQFRKADNMTDSMAALSTLANFDTASASAPSTPSTTSGRRNRWWWTSGSRRRRAHAFRARSRA